MVKTFNNPDTVAAPVAKYSHAVRLDLGNAVLIYTAGQVAVDKAGQIVGKGDIKAQTECVFENLKAILEANSASLQDIIKLTVFVTDMSFRGDLSAVRDRYLGDHAPTSTLVEVSSLASPDWLIEIEAVAAVSK